MYTCIITGCRLSLFLFKYVNGSIFINENNYNNVFLHIGSLPEMIQESSSFVKQGNHYYLLD